MIRMTTPVHYSTTSGNNMAVQPPNMQFMDYGKSVAQGNQNALAQMNMQQMPDRLQMQKENHQNSLAASKQNQDKKALEYGLTKGRFVVDQPSYDVWRNDMEQKGLVKPGQINPAYSQQGMQMIMGKASERLGRPTSGIQNYEFRQGLGTDKEKTDFDNVLRTQYKIQKINGVPTRVPVNPGQEAQPLSTLESEADAAGTIAGSKAGATETKKLGVQRALLPGIRRAVKQAEVEAKERGEAWTELATAKATLPGLMEVVDKLVTLSDVGTYTMAGKAYDLMVKELGFGSTKGATARSKMTAIVNNQVLPLLRETFGAAFTVAEGESLRATLLDVDATPEQKRATLSAFIEQKMRDIETKAARAKILSQQPENAATPQASTSPSVTFDPATGKFSDEP